MCPSHGISPDYSDNSLDWALLTKLTTQERRIQSYYFGDYYPLTPYNLSNSLWLAWQYDRPDLESGIVQAFRRADCADDHQTFKLAGLDAAATYQIQNLDTDQHWRMVGADLMENGLPIELDSKPGAALLRYDRVAAGSASAEKNRPPADYFVSTHGRDTNPGTAAEPFGTITRAQIAVQGALTTGLPRDITVQIAGESIHKCRCCGSAWLTLRLPSLSPTPPRQTNVLFSPAGLRFPVGSAVTTISG